MLVQAFSSESCTCCQGLRRQDACTTDSRKTRAFELTFASFVYVAPDNSTAGTSGARCEFSQLFDSRNLLKSIANLIVVEAAAKLDYQLTFKEHLRFGLPLTAITLVMAYFWRVVGVY